MNHKAKNARLYQIFKPRVKISNKTSKYEDMILSKIWKTKNIKYFEI